MILATRRPPIEGANMAYTIKVNGKARTVDVDPDTPLLWVLRDVLDMKGTKFGCGMALCGACTVHIDGKATRSCTLPISAVGAQSIETIEAMAAHPVGKKVQDAWMEIDVPQCGYCQAGQIMSATALLSSKPQPTDADIDAAMAGNACRCATYVRIRAAIKKAAGMSTADTRA
jgi:isoquinoline 1-oxidoreductase alpha subunit